MDPIRLMLRVAGMAVITAAGVNVLLKHLQPNSDNFVAGAIHFRKGVEEFQKGFTTLFFGRTEPSSEQARKARESTRVPIE
jgi:hypothetical protein